MPPPGAVRLNVAQLRAGIHDRIRALSHGLAQPNSEWQDLQQVNRAEYIAAQSESREVWDRIDDAYRIIRSPERIEAGMIRIYLEAANEGITPAEWLIKYFGGPDGMPVTVDDDPIKFRRYMGADKPVLDEIFKDGEHGLLTHMFQEYLLAEAWGGIEAASKFRQAIAALEDLPNTTPPVPIHKRVWDALFDSFDIDFPPVNRPEALGPILHDNLGLPGAPARVVP
jgi:hypothetical protein